MSLKTIAIELKLLIKILISQKDHTLIIMIAQVFSHLSVSVTCNKIYTERTYRNFEF